MEWTMVTVYMGCAFVGGAVLVLQLLLLFFGGDTDVDAGMDVDEVHTDGDHLGFLSIRAIAAFLTFFGLTGWWGSVGEWGTVPTLAAAVGSGSLMMAVVAWLVSLQRKLYSQGNIDPANAVGRAAKVYLRIPGSSSGKGKITVTVQGRAKQYEAVTDGPELATGSEVRVVRMTTPGTFEVAALD